MPFLLCAFLEEEKPPVFVVFSYAGVPFYFTIKIKEIK